jgi:hypothetical protein
MATASQASSGGARNEPKGGPDESKLINKETFAQVLL